MWISGVCIRKKNFLIDILIGNTDSYRYFTIT